MIGKLGWMHVIPGYYIYTGSAFGPGGLRARLARHLGPPANCHWHIDYLRLATQPVEVWTTTSNEKLEHAWAGAFRCLPHASIPLKRFGASDCRCASHLIYLPDRPEIVSFKNLLSKQPLG
jgi:Uri superfamily endonuclease